MRHFLSLLCALGALARSMLTRPAIAVLVLSWGDPLNDAPFDRFAGQLRRCPVGNRQPAVRRWLTRQRDNAGYLLRAERHERPAAGGVRQNSDDQLFQILARRACGFRRTQRRHLSGPAMPPPMDPLAVDA